MFDDLQEIAASLDGHIERAQKRREANRTFLKSLSHNPFEPDAIGPDSQFASQYRYAGGDNGGFVPFSSEQFIHSYHSSNPANKRYDADAIRTFYRTNDEFLRLAGVVTKSVGSLKNIMKGKAAAIGEVHSFGGKNYQKMGDGQWRLVSAKVPMGGAVSQPPKAQAKPPRSSMASTPLGQRQHDIHIDFEIGGKKMSHKFEGVQAANTKEAHDKILSKIQAKHPSIKFSRIKIERTK